MNKRRQLKLFPYDFVEKEKYTDDEHLAIHIWCLDKDSVPYFIRIENFPVLCYLELPMGNGLWSNVPGKDMIKTQKLLSYLHWKLGKADHEPIGSRLEYRRRIYYFKNEGELPMLKLHFKNLDSMRHCRNLLKYPIRTRGLPEFKCKMWEYDISSTRKMLTHRGMTYSQPFYIEATPIEEAFKLTEMEHEYIGDWKTMLPLPSEEADNFQPSPKIIAFDIECYSDDKRMFPNEWNVPHVAYMVSLIYQVFKQPETRKRYAVILGPCGNIPASRFDGVIVFNVQTEKQLVDKMAEIILKEDVEIVSGYNIFGFDYKYLHRRLTQKLNDWPRIGKILDEKATMDAKNWSSGAYGHNAIFDLKMAGRINVDLLPIIKREHKLMKYTLDYVANHFLGSSKHDITAQDMFWIYEEIRDSEKEMRRVYDQCGATSHLEEAMSKYEALFSKYFYQSKTVVFDLYQRYEKWILDGDIERIEDAEESAHYQLVDMEKWREITERLLSVVNPIDKVSFMDCVMRFVLANLMMAFVLLYCLQDSDLVIDLFDRLNVFVGLVQMSQVTGVTIVELFTRGQQVRCMSLLYNIAARKNYVVDHNAKPGYSYKGGFVYPPIRGIHDNVMCWDFSSLYPTIIMAYNIDHTTLIHPDIENEIPDELCNIIEFDQEEDEVTINEKTGLQETKKVLKHYRFKFLNEQKTGYKGLIPELEHTMVSERRKVRSWLKTEKDPIMCVVYQQRQLALKVVCNSFYGFLGVKNGGKMPLIEAAMSITARARASILKVSGYIEDKYKGKVVYGDSVTSDTPLVLWNKNNGCIETKRIDQLCSNQSFIPREFDDKKESVDCSAFQVWSDQGWTTIKRVIKHRTHKKIYRVVTNTGIVDVTEDHSLLNKKGEKIRPKDVKVRETILLHSMPCASENKFQLGEDMLLWTGAIDNMLKKIEVSDSIKTFFVKGKEGCAKVVLLCHCKGWHVSIRSDAKDIDLFKVTLDKRSYIKDDCVVQAITLIYDPDVDKKDIWVYDLETENHHFHVGPGNLIVHNTDSVMASLGIEDPLEAVKEGKRLEAELTALFPPPMNMELEKVMRILCLRKKRYVAALVDPETGKLGLTRGELLIKGIQLARRDFPSWITDLQCRVVLMALTFQPFKDVIQVIIKEIDDLLNGRVDYTKLITVSGLNATYKNKAAKMAMFAEELKKIGKPVQPGSRLEYLVIDNGDPKDLQGKKMRLPETYLERLNTPEEEKIDYLHYIRKLQNSIGQILTVAYIKECERLRCIKYRPTNRHGVVCFDDPMKFLYIMILHGKDYHHPIAHIDKCLEKIDSKPKLNIL